MIDVLGLEEVRRALAEDRAGEDVTTRLLGPAADARTIARFVAEGRFVVAGLPIVELIFHELDSTACLESQIAEGAWTTPETAFATLRASGRVVLAGERVALNFLQRLSGVATLTRRAVDAVAGTPARITHTRKTTPGLRALEQYAVRVGGGVDNRVSLAEAVLWKDNHWALLGTPRSALADALRSTPRGVAVMVEIEDDEQLDAALAAGVTHILADNQSPERIRSWAGRAGPGITIQASGGITPETARAYAEAGATLISIGALTHSAPAVGINVAVDTRRHAL
ncbi:MAG: carboxylating nicotinate-nucleotide diphosphorylase [Gemmatimonadetes bacterium]|nr:MAG: carboxylating nicotinate-nucleotide diphosphorylase [Gemmatimonadota bacterium]